MNWLNMLGWHRIANAYRLVDFCDGKCDPSSFCIPCTLERPTPRLPPPVIVIGEADVLRSILSANDGR